MANPFPEKPVGLIPPPPGSEWIEPFVGIRRQYARACEYCGFTIDDLVNSPEAQSYLRQIWLLGCLIHKPEKAAALPPGNPFRTGDKTERFTSGTRRPGKENRAGEKRE